MRHENQQKLRHSGQHFLLIRNDRQGWWKCNRIVGTILAHSTVYWIPGQARYDGFLVNGTAVVAFYSVAVVPRMRGSSDFGKNSMAMNMSRAAADKIIKRVSNPQLPCIHAISGTADAITENVTMYLREYARLRHSLLAMRPTSTSLMGIWPKTTNMNAMATNKAGMPVNWLIIAKKPA